MKNQVQSDRQVVMKIRNLRVSKSYTQDYLAYKLKISQNAYSKIELYKSRLTLDRLFEIAKILDVEVIDMLKEADKEQSISHSAWG